MRKNFFIPLLSIIIILTTIFLTAFGIYLKKFRKEDSKMYEPEINGFIVNNDKLLSDTISPEYSITELKSFFGTQYANEAITLEKNEYKSLNWENVNSKFPIQNLRYNRQSYYSVYRVKESGLFYVFWSVTPNNQINLKDSSDTTVYFCAYLNKTKKVSDFKNIKENISTADDLFLIDGATELNLLSSSGIYSYSLLDNDKILEIKYTYNGDFKKRSDLIVESISFKKKDRVYSCLSSIYSKDLP